MRITILIVLVFPTKIINDPLYRIQTDQAVEIARLIKQYITIDQR